MELTDVQIGKFQTLYKKRFGVELSKKDALHQAIELLGVMSSVHRPITKEQLSNHTTICKELEQTHVKNKN